MPNTLKLMDTNVSSLLHHLNACNYWCDIRLCNFLESVFTLESIIKHKNFKFQKYCFFLTIK